MSHKCSPLCIPPIHALRMVADVRKSLEMVKEDAIRGLREEGTGLKLLHIREVHEVPVQEWMSGYTDVTCITENHVWPETSMYMERPCKAYIAFVEVTTGRFSSKEYIKE